MTTEITMRPDPRPMEPVTWTRALWHPISECPNKNLWWDLTITEEAPGIIVWPDVRCSRCHAQPMVMEERFEPGLVVPQD